VSKTRLRPGLRPGPRWESLQRSQDPLAGFGGGEGRIGRGLERGTERKGGREKGREGKGKGRSPSSKNSGYGLAM